jgi:cellulose synthase/poly-beta-1,6-N-acetylglucosamine synthase-like glycosyltransferase
MLILFYILVVEQILQGVYNLWDSYKWMRAAQRGAASYPGFYAPTVAVFCPVKGLEPGLEQNLTALTRFDYPNYEVFFILASVDDPAQNLAAVVAAKSKPPAQVILAGRAHDCSEKVNNLRVAIERVGERFDAFVFCDSDGRPPRGWLKRLVGPLAEPRLGAATTFRWYLVERGGFWNALLSAWNAPLATFLGEHGNNFCWGGGTAIRREMFDSLHVMARWQGAASDDFALTRVLRDANAPIRFVPECLVPSIASTTAAGFFEFTNRQMILTRVYEPRLWWRGGLAHFVYALMLILGISIAAGNWVAGLPIFQIITLMLLPPLLAVVRGVLRLVAVVDLLPEWKQPLLAQGWIWTVLAPLVPLVSLWNHFVSATTRRITWRGVRYELASPAVTRVLPR